MAGFTRTGGLLQPLSPEELEQIHAASLRLLENTGLVIRDGEILSLLEQAGCRVEVTRDLAKMPASLVRDAVAQSPRIVTLCGRESRHDLSLGDGRAYARTPGGATRILDPENGAVRDATKTDVEECVRLADALPNIHGISMCQVVPLDVPRHRMDLHSAEASFANTRKHLFYVCHNEELIDAVIDMAASLAGGPDGLRERPILSPLCESTSPLMVARDQAKVLKSFAARGLPLRLHAHPMAGLSSPVTLAGELVVTNAEVLGMVVIAHCLAPRLPVVYGMSSSVPDMATGKNLAGAVEIGLLGAAVAQLARFYGLPSSVSSGIDAPMPGAQAMLERLMTALPPILAGVDLINLCTTGGKMVFSPEQLVMDDETMQWVGRYLQGICVNDETMALDLIETVGPGGLYVDQGHTARHFREELLHAGLIRERGPEEFTDLRELARQKVWAILRNERARLRAGER
jgi:trimethylamine--corrinoid protein Co-methyltransferase